METTILTTFNDRFLANLAIAKLRDEGITAFLENDEEVLINPGNLIGSNIRIRVMDYDLEKAIICLDDLENS